VGRQFGGQRPGHRQSPVRGPAGSDHGDRRRIQDFHPTADVDLEGRIIDLAP
jgi:hypothetical protein